MRRQILFSLAKFFGIRIKLSDPLRRGTGYMLSFSQEAQLPANPIHAEL